MSEQFQYRSPTEFVLPDGRIIKLRAVSTARLRAAESKARKILEARGLSFEPPTYTPVGVNPAPGVVVEPVVYDDKTIQEAPEDIQEKYRQYQSNLRQAQQLAVGQMLSTLILRGTEYEMPTNGWEADQVEDGMEVPQPPDEKYVHYMLTEVLIPPSVAEACAVAVMRLSLEGVDPEVMEAFESSFRHPLQDKKRAHAK